MSDFKTKIFPDPDYCEEKECALATHLFVSERSARPLAGSMLYKWITRSSAEIGLPMFPHNFRHGFPLTRGRWSKDHRRENRLRVLASSARRNAPTPEAVWSRLGARPRNCGAAENAHSSVGFRFWTAGSMTALPLRRGRGCAATPTETPAHRACGVSRASGAGSRRSRFCERDEAPIFSTVHVFYTAHDVNQFVNHRDEATGAGRLINGYPIGKYVIFRGHWLGW